MPPRSAYHSPREISALGQWRHFGGELVSLFCIQLRTWRCNATTDAKCQKLTQMPTGSPLRAAVVFQSPTDSVAGILPLGYEYVPAAILGQRADVRHQPVSTRNGELVGDRAIEDLPSRFDSHLRILVDSELPLGIC